MNGGWIFQESPVSIGGTIVGAMIPPIVFYALALLETVREAARRHGPAILEADLRRNTVPKGGAGKSDGRREAALYDRLVSLKIW
jgi:hypothetical protein